MQRKKAIKTCAVILLAAVLIFHAVWLVNFLRYRPFVSRIPKDEVGNRGYTDEDKTVYSAFYPHYPDFTGNLSVMQMRNANQKVGDCYLDMVIWPLPFRNRYEFGVTVSTVTAIGEDGSFTVFNTRFVMDENKHFLKEPYPEEREVFRQYESMIDEYYKKAIAMWGLPDPEQ